MSKCDECLITQLKDRIEHLETTVFALVWNRGVAPVGMSLGKTEEEMADKTLETISEIEKMIIYPVMQKRLKGAKERREAAEYENKQDGATI